MYWYQFFFGCGTNSSYGCEIYEVRNLRFTRAATRETRSSRFPTRSDINWCVQAQKTDWDVRSKGILLQLYHGNLAYVMIILFINIELLIDINCLHRDYPVIYIKHIRKCIRYDIQFRGVCKSGSVGREHVIVHNMSLSQSITRSSPTSYIYFFFFILFHSCLILFQYLL